MKKLSKFIYFIFAFALITCMAIFNPAIDFASAEEGNATSSSKSISISNSKIASTIEAKDAEKGLIIPIPTVTGASSSAKNYVVVTDRSGTQYTYDCQTGKTLDKNGKEVTITNGETTTPVKYFSKFNSSDEEIAEVTEANAGDVEYIKVANLGKGTYSVQYKVVDGNKTYYSETKSVQVKSVAYSWEFNATGAKNIIPSVTNANSTYTLPLPKVVNSVDSTTETFTKADIGTKIIVTNSGVDVTTDVLKPGVDDDNNVYFTPTLAEGEDSDTYIIKYVSNVPAFANKTFTVKVEKDYNTTAELEATHNAITNYQVGAVTTFPTVNVTDKTHNNSNIEVNNVIVIQKSGVEYARLTANDYTYKFTESGTYTIQYEVTDAYGNSAKSKTTSITVSDKKPYSVSYADGYTITTDTDWEASVNTDIAHKIPSEVGFGGFYVPAIYAKDYVDSYDQLTFSRKLVATDGSGLEFNIDSVEGNAAYVAPAEGNRYNESILFQFPAEGDTEAEKLQYIKDNYAGKTFKLVYTAKDSNAHNTEAKATEYTIKIANVEALTNNIDKNLQINFPTINDAIDPNAELSFTSATAKEDPTDSSLIADARVQVRTFYYYGAKTEIETALSTYISNISVDYDGYIEKYGYKFDDFLAQLEDGNIGDTYVADIAVEELTMANSKTSIKLGSDYTSQPKVTIFAVAINDQGQFVIEAQEVAINNTNESGAPTIIATSDLYTVNNVDVDTIFNQNYEVTLPSVTFMDLDAVDKSLQVDIKCYVDTPDQTVGISIDEFIQKTTGECGIGVAKLTTTYAGTYYVVYTATDDAGNTATYISTFDVAKTEKAYIDVENGSNISANVGDDVKLNISLAGNGTYENEEITVTWGDNKPSGLGSLPNSYKFNKAGTYVATIKAIYTMNGQEIKDTPSVTVTITVTEPDMEWADDVDEILVNRTANKGETIELPVISATENGVEINATPKVVFVGSDDKEVEVEVTFDQDTFNNYTFVADKDGVYTVTYTATTAYNSESKSFTVTCGDYYEPTIIFGSNKLEGSNVTYNGKDITLTVEFNQQKDENDDKITGKYTLTVLGKDADGKEVINYDINVDLKDTDAEEAINYFTPDSWSFDLSGDNASKNSTNKWTISGVGSYELKLTVKDTNGNSTTKAIKFNVNSKTEPKSIKDDVVGIVLIVVSVVILGGVILFFALAGKRNKTKRTSVKTNKD